MACGDQDWIDPYYSNEADDESNSSSDETENPYTYGQAVQDHKSKNCRWVKTKLEAKNVRYVQRLKLSCECGEYDDGDEELHYNKRCRWLPRQYRDKSEYDNYLVRHCRCFEPEEEVIIYE